MLKKPVCGRMRWSLVQYGIMEFGLDVYLECKSQDIFDLCLSIWFMCDTFTSSWLSWQLVKVLLLQRMGGVFVGQHALSFYPLQLQRQENGNTPLSKRYGSSWAPAVALTDRSRGAWWGSCWHFLLTPLADSTVYPCAFDYWGSVALN